MAIASSQAGTGVALVHGKGAADLATQAMANAYWGSAMIAACSTSHKGTRVPCLVCHYDGTQDMWTAADQVAAELVTFIKADKITDLVIDTHSFGGVVMRAMFSVPTRNPNYQTVLKVTRWVNTLAAPQKGSEAANLAGHLSASWLTGWLVDLMGDSNASTVNCQTSVMAYNNAYLLKGTAGRPVLPVPFKNVAGLRTMDEWTDATDYELTALAAVSDFPGANDGMVGQYSAQAVGTVRFTTPANHDHSRNNDYCPIGTMLATDF